MSEHESAVDLDLLADYVGGALEGTPEESRVAALVRTDPEWAREHDLLAAALDATADDLATFAAYDVAPMPADVSDRLLAALTAAGTPEPTGAAGADGHGHRSRAGAASTPRGAAAAPDRGGRPGRDGRTAVPAAGHAGPGRSRRRRRWVTWTAPVAVAVAVAAFAGFWINQSTGMQAGGAADTSVAEQAPAAGQPPGADSRYEAPAAARQSSGRDYSPAVVMAGPPLTTMGDRSAATPGASAAQGVEEDGGGASKSAAPPGLARLSDPSALGFCIETITRELGRGPLTVQVVDFAAYEGKPAIVVFFTDPMGQQWGWVSGPDCGPGGTDERYRARVG